jgi:hypothetical protein
MIVGIIKQVFHTIGKVISGFLVIGLFFVFGTFFGMGAVYGSLLGLQLFIAPMNVPQNNVQEFLQDKYHQETKKHRM